MNRKIKFRAWDKEEKKMYYYHPLSFLDDSDGSDIATIQIDRDRDWVDSHFSKSTAKKMVLMQDTELKDKQGKEIYEGDILDGVDLVEKYIVEDIYDINYDNREMIFDVVESKVIGNIYENSNLLKSKK